MRNRGKIVFVILILALMMSGCEGKQSPIQGLNYDLYIQGNNLLENIMSDETKTEIEELANNDYQTFDEIFEEFDKKYDLELPSNPSDEDKVYKNIVTKICIMKRTVIASETQMKDMNAVFPLVVQQNEEENEIIELALTNIESASNLEDLNVIYDTMKDIK